MTNEQRQRLLAETRETAARLNKLNAFMASKEFPGLPREDKDLLYEQQRTMSRYVQILGKRLERAGEIFSHALEDAHKPLPGGAKFGGLVTVGGQDLRLVFGVPGEGFDTPHTEVMIRHFREVDLLELCRRLGHVFGDTTNVEDVANVLYGYGVRAQAALLVPEG